MKESKNPLIYFKGLIARFAVSILIGVLIDLCFSFAWSYLSGSDVLTHLKSIYASNSEYLSSNPLIDKYLWYWLQHYGMDYLTQLSSNLQGSWFVLVSILITSLFVVLQRSVIALVSLPLYIVCVVVGMIDGLVGRELRRYQAGIESTRRDYYMRWVAFFEYVAFIGYMTIPLFINPVIWFFSFGVLVACIHRMAITYIQKYW